MKETKKQFFRYDKDAEDKVKMCYEHIITLANLWAIPLMRIFNEPVTLDNVRKVMKEGVKEHFVSVLISRHIEDPKAFAAMLEYKPKAEREFLQKLEEVIREWDNYKAIEHAQTKRYERTTWLGTRVVEPHEISQEQKDWQRQKLIESGKDKFFSLVEQYDRQAKTSRTLENALAKGAIIWGEDCVKFDDAKIKADCALYLEGEDIAFVEGLKGIAKAINAAYKGGLTDLRYIVYLLDCKDGKAVLNPDKIDLVDLMQYGPITE